MKTNRLSNKYFTDSFAFRLDAGSFGTMGVGAGFAVAAALVEQTQAVCEGRQPKKVICIQGDSAFGFGAMELETAARYRLPIIFVVANNNGIYNGMDLSSWNEMLNEATQDTLPLVIPPVLLDPANRYERIMHAFNCEGYDVVTTEDLIHSFEKSLKETKKPSLIHIHIEASSQRKTQV